MLSLFKKSGCLIILLLLISFPAKAAVNDALLRIHATLLPKIVLMDYQFEQKLVDNSIVIRIICDKKDQLYAERLREYILKKHKNGIKDYPVKVEISSYNENLASGPAATIFYLMPSSSRLTRKALKSIPDHRLIFSCDPSALRFGAVISVKVLNNIKPIINIDALKEKNITLRPVIMKISKIYYQPKH